MFVRQLVWSDHADDLVGDAGFVHCEDTQTRDNEGDSEEFHAEQDLLRRRCTVKTELCERSTDVLRESV